MNKQYIQPSQINQFYVRGRVKFHSTSEKHSMFELEQAQYNPKTGNTYYNVFPITIRNEKTAKAFFMNIKHHDMVQMKLFLKVDMRSFSSGVQTKEYSHSNFTMMTFFKLDENSAKVEIENLNRYKKWNGKRK